MPKLSKRSTNKTARRQLFWNFCLKNRTISSMETDFFIWLRYLFECNDLKISDGLRLFAKQTILNLVC